MLPIFSGALTSPSMDGCTRAISEEWQAMRTDEDLLKFIRNHHAPEHQWCFDKSQEV